MRRMNFTHCFIGVTVAVALLLAFGVQLSSLALLAAVLVCPLIMVVMMRGMMRGHGADQGVCDHSDHQHGQASQGTDTSPTASCKPRPGATRSATASSTKRWPRSTA